jgi:hypothetical protein
MAKTLTVLNNAVTLVQDFHNIFDGSAVAFVILGNTANHQSLARQAANLAINWEIAVFVPDPTPLYADLLALATDNCALPAAYDPSTLFAVTAATDKTICYVMDTYDPQSISIAYMLAESF